MNVYLRQQWNDPRLRYINYSSYANITHLTIDSKLIERMWVPDLFFPNEKSGHPHCITMPNRLVRVFQMAPCSTAPGECSTAPGACSTAPGWSRDFLCSVLYHRSLPV